MIKVQIKILTGLILFLSMITHISFAQDSTTKQFYSLFKEIEFDVLHVFSRHIPDGTYPFKGVKIDTSFYKLFEDVIPYLSNHNLLFATYRFHITSTNEALLMRESQYTDGDHIYCLVYDNTKSMMVQAIEFSSRYSEEGVLGNKESWIIDVNKDRQKNIISQSWSERYFDDTTIVEDSKSISFWLKNEWVSTEITDTLLRKKLEGDLSYYKIPSLGDDTKQQIKK